MKVTTLGDGFEGSFEGMGTEKAPIRWVMPPASPFATAVLRRVSRRVVLPWSTWPCRGRREEEEREVQMLGFYD
jgi:hypothetical protein